MLGGSAAVIVLVVGVCCYYMFFYSATPLAGKDELLTLAENEKRAEDEKARQEAAAKQAAEEEKARQAKEDEARRRAEEAALERKKKEEADRRAAVEETERAKQREKEENEERAKNMEKDARDKLVNVAFNDIVVTDVICHTTDSDKEKQFREKLKMLKLSEASLTNGESIVAWYLAGGQPQCTFCHFEEVLKKDPRTGKKVASYSLKDEGIPADANWVLWRIVDFGGGKTNATCAAIWHWLNNSGPIKLFERSDKVDLWSVCFGVDEARRVYARAKKVFYRVSWDEGGGRMAFETYSPECTIDIFKQDQQKNDAELKDLQQKLFAAQEDEKKHDKKVKEANKIRQDVEKYEEELIRLTNEKEKEKDPDKKKRKATAIEARKKTINGEIVQKLDDLGIHGQKLNGTEAEKKRILESIDKKISALEEDVKAAQEDVRNKKEAVETKKGECDSWKRSARSRIYFVEVISEMKHGDGTSYNMNGQKGQK